MSLQGVLLTTVAGSGVGVPTLPLVFMWTSTALHNAVSWKAFVLLLSICSQCLGANRKDILETFTEGPSRWLNKHLVLMHLCVRHHTSHRELGEGDISVTHLPNVARLEFVTPTLTGALRSAFLTVTTPGHNWIFRY